MAEVFITDAVRTGPDSYLVAAQWPRDHALYHPGPTGHTDPLLLAETLRQALVYLAHQYHDVPLTHRFIGCGMDFTVTDGEALRVRAVPLPVVLEARWVWTANRPPRRYGIRLDVALTVDGRVCGHGSLEVLAVDSRAYGILRGRVADPVTARADPGGGPAPADAAPAAWRRVPAARVGRLRDKDSVLEEAVPAGPGDLDAAPGTAWRMRADLRHAILFDHPSDHLPLMVTLEGCRQLGHLLAHDGRDGPYVLVSCAVECAAFAELSPPVVLLATESAGPREVGTPAGPGRSRAPGVAAEPGESGEREEPAASGDARRSGAAGVTGATGEPRRNGPGAGPPQEPHRTRHVRIEAVQAGRTVAVTHSVWAPVRAS